MIYDFIVNKPDKISLTTNLIEPTNEIMRGAC